MAKTYFTEQVNEKNFEVLTNARTVRSVKNYILRSKPWLGELGYGTDFSGIENIREIKNKKDVKTIHFASQLNRANQHVFLVVMRHRGK